MNSFKNSVITGCNEWLVSDYFSKGKSRKKRRTKILEEKVNGVELKDYNCGYLPNLRHPRHNFNLFLYFMLIFLLLNSIYGD